jgi:hypothetical protein
VRSSFDTVIDIPWIMALQQHLHTLNRQGYALGPAIALLAIDAVDGPSDVLVSPDIALDLCDGFTTVGAYFRLGGKSKRELFDSDLEALILSHSVGAQSRGRVNELADVFSEWDTCGRCCSLSHGKCHGTCSQAYIDGLLLKGGVCTNCLRSGSLQACSFRRKFLTCLQTSCS